MTAFHPDQHSFFSHQEIEAIGDILLNKYGFQAKEIADLFVDEHVKANDVVRAEAWQKVAEYLSRGAPNPEIAMKRLCH